MKIVSFKICPFVQRVTTLLEAKNISYEVEFISLSDKPQWFLDVSPNGQVPILITDNDITLFESDAIIEYLEEKYIPLQKKLTPEQKAINRAWSYLATKNYLVQCSAQRSSDKQSLIEKSKKLNKAFDTIEKEVGKFKYFNSDTIGMVDIAWLPILHRAKIIERESGYDFLKNRPNIKKWQSIMLKTGLAEKSVSKDFEEKFINFYLSDKTYLGGNKKVSACGNTVSSNSCGC